MGFIESILKAIGHEKEVPGPSVAEVETQVMSDEEKCAEMMRKLNQEKADDLDRERRYEARKALHLKRCEKVRDFLKERPDRCFNNKLLAKELQAENEEERNFFEKFSSEDMYFGGYGIKCYYEFCFFNNEGEEFFMYVPQTL